MSYRPGMKCPRCSGQTLTAMMSKQGVEVDSCPSCNGIWLDKGEIFYFTGAVKTLVGELKRAQAGAVPGELPSPVSGRPMQKVTLFGQVEVDWCKDSDGLWFDQGELSQIARQSEDKLRLSMDDAASRSRLKRASDGSFAPDDLARYAAEARPLPHLFVRSVGLLFLLYALLGALLITAVELGFLKESMALLIGVGVAALQFALGPWIMDFTLGWFYSTEWVEPSQLPAHLREFIQRVCGQQRIRFPRIGIIADGAPNAFTYGHVPGNARIVITRGLFELLEPEELEAVVAHEIGHAVQWDMVLMTVAQLVPLIAYYVYRTVIRIRTRSGKDQTAAARTAIAVGAYVVYIISEYIVLWLSRTREYRADNFAGRVTGNPNLLAAALVKIGYGLAGQEKKDARDSAKDSSRAASRRPGLEAIGALGIFDGKAARAFAVAAVGTGGGTSLDPDHLKGAMRWDLWNPWARFYEINSTHPLIANRLDYLSRQAAAMRLSPLLVFDEQQPESYWDEFFVDLLIMALPILLAAGALAAALFTKQLAWLWLAISVYGLGSLVKTWFSYRARDFPALTVAGLLKNVKVSGIRGVPCSIKGTVIGRGVPGLIWSEDVVVRDRTGIMFLDYRQPLALWELLFGLLRRRELDGAEVTATGWYRRSPTPYIELRSIATQGSTRRCYVYPVKVVFGFVLILLGLFLAGSVR